MRVRAKQTVKHGSKWYLPGDEFELPPEVAEMRVRTGAVEYCAAPPELSGLPDDLPFRSVLEGLGFDSLDEVRGVEDLTKLKGIGKKSAEAILKYLGG